MTEPSDAYRRENGGVVIEVDRITLSYGWPYDQLARLWRRLRGR